MGMLSRISALFGRSDEDALSVPPMDGVFKPNALLDAAEHVLDLPAIDNLAVSADGGLHCSSGNALFRIDLQGRTPHLIRAFDDPIRMIATRPSGGFAIAAEGMGLAIMDEAGGFHLVDLPTDQSACITAGVFEDDDTLLLAVGSRQHSMSDWKRDLMSHGTSGLVIRHTITTGRTEILESSLAFPYGLARLADGAIAATMSRSPSMSSKAWAITGRAASAAR